VKCETQPEVDELWEKLSAGGKTDQCVLAKGQIWPVVQNYSNILGEMLNDKDPENSKKSHASMLKMTKIDMKA